MRMWSVLNGVHGWVTCDAGDNQTHMCTNTFSAWEVNSFRRNQMSKHRLGHSIVHHHIRTVSTFFKLNLIDSFLKLSNPTSRLGSLSHPQVPCDLLLCVSRLDLVLAHKLHTTTGPSMFCQHVIFNFSGRWIRWAVPASQFSNFSAADGISVADITLCHFVSHVGIVRSPCRHVWHLWWQP